MAYARPAKVAHILYRTRRFDEMLQWYEAVFGARLQYQNTVPAFLTFDDGHHRFALVNMSVLQPDATDTDRQGAIGVDHLGYSYASLRELLETYSVLKEKGITPYWCFHHGITASLYYADPDGNQMELQVDCLGSSAEATSYMERQFSSNPVGVEYDPEERLARLRNGEAESEFLSRKLHEPVSSIRGSLAKYMAS